jgi:hypothetical protein
MPHWNGIIVAETLPELEPFKKDPVGYSNELKRVAKQKYDSDLCHVSWEQGTDNWRANVTLSGGRGDELLRDNKCDDYTTYLSPAEKAAEGNTGA